MATTHGTVGRIRAVGYVRVSSDRQEASIETQRAKLVQYALLYDILLVDIFADEGVSGTQRKRPGLTAALEMLTEGKADALLVFQLDRLTRSLAHLAELLKKYFSNGWALMSVTDQLDTKTAAGRMVVHILGAVHQWYAEDVGEKTLRELQEKKARGEKLGGALPFGYRLGRDGVKLVPDKGEQRVLRQIAAWRKQGHGTRVITRKLNELAATNRTYCPRGERWHLTTVARLLARLPKKKATERKE